MADPKPPAVQPDAVTAPAPRATFETVAATHMVPKPPERSLAERRAEVIRQVDGRIRRRATRIVEAVADAARLDDDGLPVDGTRIDLQTKRPEGWSGVRYRVAMDARRPEKTAPGYLKHMLRVHESYQRADAAQVKPPELGAGVVINLQQNNTYQYPTKDVTEAVSLEPAPKRK